MDIKEGDLNDKRVIQLIEDHMTLMKKYSPPSAYHFLDLHEYEDPKLTIWTAWGENELLGMGALKELSPTHGELKSIKTHEDHLREGVAQNIVGYILKQAIKRGYTQVSLETGSQKEFEPAIQFYKSIGFKECGPFDGYEEDPASVFMTQFID
jgi:putative acetyltransferase